MGVVRRPRAQDSPAPAAAWSEWQPRRQQRARVKQIADHVPGATPRAASSSPSPRRPPSADVCPVRTAAHRARSTSRGSRCRPTRLAGRPRRANTTSYDAANASVQALRRRGQLLDRGREAVRRPAPPPAPEALELSLYTFRYVDGIDNVWSCCRRRAGRERPAQQTGASFSSAEVAAELGVPLARTLPALPRDRRDDGRRAQPTDRLTRPNLYSSATGRRRTGALSSS